MTILYRSLEQLAAAYLLWVLYLAITNLYQAKREGTLTRSAYALSLPLLLVGIVLDVFVQFTFAWALFSETPHEWTVSKRVDRLVLTGSGWRQKVAVWVRVNLLRPFDRSGGHG